MEKINCHKKEIKRSKQYTFGKLSEAEISNCQNIIEITASRYSRISLSNLLIYELTVPWKTIRLFTHRRKCSIYHELSDNYKYLTECRVIVGYRFLGRLVRFCGIVLTI